MKPFFQNNLGKLFNNDCIQTMELLIDNNVKVDAIITDLPYGITQSEWDTVIPVNRMWELIEQLKKDVHTPVMLFGAEPFSSLIRTSNLKDYKYDWKYKKKRKTNFLNAKKQPLRCSEDIMVFYTKQCLYKPIKSTGHKPVNKFIKKDKTAVYAKQKEVHGGGNTDRYPYDVLEFDVTNEEVVNHANQKPLELIEYLIKTYTNEMDIVLDFTSGSGTTAVASERLNRKWICIEINEEYVNTTIERLKNNQLKLL